MKYALGATNTLWTKMLAFDRGDIEPAHEHQFDHFTLLASGRLKVLVEGRESIFERPRS